MTDQQRLSAFNLLSFLRKLGIKGKSDTYSYVVTYSNLICAHPGRNTVITLHMDSGKVTAYEVLICHQ